VDISALASGPFKWQSAATLGGKLYAAPYCAEAILVYDPAAGEANVLDTTGVTSGPGKWGTTLVLGGRLYGVPYDTKQLLVHEPEGAAAAVQDRSEDLPVALDQGLLEDFIAAWLSEWIYEVEDVSHPRPVAALSLGGEAVEFTVHRVYEDPLQGSPARLATVTAAAPGRGKVVFLVFKGSAFLADFVANASVSPDYTPFHQAFDDSTTFIHHGAHHAVAQLRVHQWTILLEQMKAASADGVKRVIVTGHSLGGQYAAAFMLQVFLHCRAAAPGAEDGAQELLSRVRCVSFGSPMCFGAAEGTEVRRDLADFVRGRAVNYIHGGDPAPRLWSELNLEDFMRYFVDWLHGQISGFSRRIVDYAVGPGGLAKRAEELLQRPDIEVHLLRPAARYVHLPRIRILAESFRPWRPLGQDSIKIEDHRMLEGYIQAFRASLDPEALGGLYDEEGKELVSYALMGLA